MRRPAHRAKGAAPLALAALLLALFGASARAETVTFGFTGAEQTFPVPAGVTSVHVVAVGGRGGTGAGNGSPGGMGARVTTDLAVTPGQVLFVEVGGNGGDGAGTAGGDGGFNGGGKSQIEESSGSGGGGGGGASDVRLVSRAQAGTLASRLLVAGGGGGSGGSSFGGAGGAAGQNGSVGVGSAGGGAGTAATAAAGGKGQANAGTNGTSGQGGLGGYSYSKQGGGNAGGGGGGLFGGGGGGGALDVSSGGGGGGGGSSIGGAVTLDTIGVPSVTVTYTTPAAPGGNGGSGGGKGENGNGSIPAALETTIDAHPGKLIETSKEKVRVKFRFSANRTGASFLCKLDGNPFAPCLSPKRYRVEPGQHTFKVKAVGDPTPAVFSLRVKRKP
jgi:hypothetical protein